MRLRYIQRSTKIADKCRYYLAENREKYAVFQDVTADREPIYAKLARPLRFWSRRSSQMKKLCEYAVFGSHRSTLKEDSIDNSEPGHICYMTESERETINFDGVKTEYLNQRGLSEENAKSVDSLLEKDGILYMIEFKNGNMKSEKSRVKIKIRDSLLIFCDIVKENISFTRENMDFILVYNEEKNPKRSKTEITKDSFRESRRAILPV